MTEANFSQSTSVNLSCRVTLSPAEAAEALGVSENHFRSEILPGLAVVRSGRRVLVPVEQLRSWVRERSEATQDRIPRAIDELLNGTR